MISALERYILPDVNDEEQHHEPRKIRVWHTTVPMRSLVGGRLSFTWELWIQLDKRETGLDANTTRTCTSLGAD